MDAWVLPVHLEERCQPSWDSIGSRGAFVADRKSKGYRVVAVSLYEDEADEADRLTEILKNAGWHKANRSLVIREALECLQGHLRGKSAEEIFRYFLERLARRATSPRKRVQGNEEGPSDDSRTKN